MQNDENKVVKKSFFQGMRSELKKVVWPSARQTSKNTLVTIVFVLLVSIVLIVCNMAFDFISKGYYNLVLGNNTSSNQVVNEEVVNEEVVNEEVVSGEVLSDEEVVPEVEPVEEQTEVTEQVETEVSE